MENECILTVSVAAYNVEKYLSEALEPFADDKLNDRLEVLIISDGSTDKTETIGQSFVERYPRIFKLIKKKNGGWGSTVNKGMSVAKGKYFKQLDGDDYFKKETMEEFVDFLATCDEDLIVSPFAMFDDETGNISKIYDFDEAVKNCSFPVKIEKFIKYYRLMAMHAACLKTRLLTENKVTLDENCFYTDIEFIVKSISYVKTVNLFNKIVYMYRVGRDGQSMSLQGQKKHYKDHQNVALELSRLCDDYAGSETVKEVIVDRTVEMLVKQYEIYFLLQRSKQHKNELKEYDRLLKLKFPSIYKLTNIGKKIDLLRATEFRLYDAIKIMRDVKLAITKFKLRKVEEECRD